MEQIPPPPHVIAARPECIEHSIAPPPGEDDIYSASALVDPVAGLIYLHWKPQKDEIEALAAGGTLELVILGHTMPPVNLAVYPIP